jgi:1-acyl-sn-glycerol-3-phosphate acyltransferase
MFFLIYLLCEVMGILASGGLWLILLGGAIGGPKRFIDANAALQRSWSDALLRGVMVVYGMTLRVENGDLARPAPYLLFVRHSSTADTVIAAAVVANPNRVLLKYVLKRELLWDPCLDIVGRRLPNAFVDRSPGHQEGQSAAIARLAIGLDACTGVLIYPEGTRFSPKKLAAALAHLRETGRPELASIAAEFQSVLPPRLGGVLSMLDAAPGVDVIFLDQTGFEGAESFRAFLGGALFRRTISVRLRRVRAADIPETGRDRWLFEQWRETDRWVTQQLAKAGR